MTIATSTGRVQYNGNGATVLFTVPFYFLDNSHLQVVVTSSAGVDSTKVLTTDYTVSGAGNPAGGSITMLSAPAIGEKLAIIRSIPITQTTDLVDNDPLPAEVLETSLDKAAMIDQQLAEKLDRALIMSAGTTVSGQLPDAATRADKLLAFDASGNPTVVVPPTGTAAALQVDLASTAAGKGAAMVGFIQSGAGAVARTAQSKLRDVVSVKDFGAVGDGATNDTAAFTAATATNQPIFVPQSSSFYSLTALTSAQQKLLYGPGVVKVSGSQVQISAAPFIDNDTAHIRVYNAALQPSKWPTVAGSLRNGAVSIVATRTGGFGSYGLSLTEYLVSDSLPAGEFDSGSTAWVTAQNMSGGQVFGAWFGANTPSSSLGGQTFSSGGAIGLEVNVGNRWSDLGLQNDIGGTNYTTGVQIVPDVLPALDGTTAAIYPGTFGLAISPSITGHKWWTGIVFSVDSIVPGGRAINARGGSTVPNAAGALIRATENWTRGLDFSGATISSQAILLGASHVVSWGGSAMSGTATAWSVSTGTGTGEGGLYANNYGQLALRWASSGSAPQLGFFGAAVIGKPTVTGSRGANAALASLLTALSNLGLVTDSST